MPGRPELPGHCRVGPTWQSCAKPDFVRQRSSARLDMSRRGTQKEYICGRPGDANSQEGHDKATEFCEIFNLQSEKRSVSQSGFSAGIFDTDAYAAGWRGREIQNRTQLEILQKGFNQPGIKV
jgi:hypothetical protein